MNRTDQAEKALRDPRYAKLSDGERDQYDEESVRDIRLTELAYKYDRLKAKPWMNH